MWRKRGSLRPLLAVVAAYALALQALLGAVALGQMAEPGDAFAICHAGEAGAPADQQKSQAHECPLCTLCSASHAMPGGGQVAAALYVGTSSIHVFADVERIASFQSPTGQHQRGPPGAFFSG